MERIRKGDEVVVISGRDKGKRGTVLARVDERHVTLPIDISNVMLWNAATGKGDRVGIKTVDGKKLRVFKSNGATVGAK